MLHLVRPHAHIQIHTHRYYSCAMFSQTERSRRREREGEQAQTLSSLSLACPCCVHLSAHFKKATWGWIRLGWVAFGRGRSPLPLRQMQQVYDADCQNAALSIYVCVSLSVSVCIKIIAKWRP